MLSRWRSKCFFNRPAKHLHALVYGAWFDIEPACPLLVRAESVHNNRLGSFYCAMLHEVVQ